MLYLFSIFVLTLSNLEVSDWAPNIGEDLIVNLPYLEISPKVDGIIGKDEYSKAKILTNFTEWEPIENSKPPVKTEVFVGYDEYSLYIAFKCYESDITELRSDFAQRDKCYDNDEVNFYIDTYGDLKDAYDFFSNPKGVQSDAIIKTDRSDDEDVSYDVEWTVSTKVNETFWTAEFKIPFSSLKFNRKGQKKWRVNFFRTRPRRNTEIYSWAPISKDKSGWISQGGTFIIDKDIFGGKKLEFIVE